jgi:hypothetical protein
MKQYVQIKNDEKGYPKFFIEGKPFKQLDWELKYIKTEKKEITPKIGKNAGKEITIKNLILWLEDDDWLMEISIDLYSSPARNVINSLAWPDELWKVYLSVYNNKWWYRTISVKKNNLAEWWWYTPYYSYEKEKELIEVRKIQWEEKKDYDWLTDRYIEELLPLIASKIENYVPTFDDVSNDKPYWEEDNTDNEDLPFK